MPTFGDALLYAHKIPQEDNKDYVAENILNSNLKNKSYIPISIIKHNKKLWNFNCAHNLSEFEFSPLW